MYFIPERGVDTWWTGIILNRDNSKSRCERCTLEIREDLDGLLLVLLGFGPRLLGLWCHLCVRAAGGPLPNKQRMFRFSRLVQLGLLLCLALPAGANGATRHAIGTSPWTQPWTPTQPPGQPLSQYVKPVKVAPPPLAERDLRSGAAPTTGSPPLRPSGHFRHMQADLWDPHPQYRFTAFGISFWLQLAHDAGFVDPNILVTHMTHNTTVRSPARQHAQCFYTGRVRDDQKSSVAVNLCHGMRGTIRTSQGSFFIEPVEEERPVDEDDNDAGEEDAGTGAAAASAGQASPRPSPLHVIYRVPKPPHENLAEEPTHHCGMVDGESTFSPVGET
ncbi:hypothetical protein FOCC_FOCC013834 [Frankliniella occidentalis]|nr:hypothetical protein FOCC_FOCC013834 [Frankliniella occidentalis]